MIALVLLLGQVCAQSYPVQVAEPDYSGFTFAYKGHDWGGICSYGRSQSPIDIVTASTQVQVVSQANSSFAPLSVSLQTVNRSDILVENVSGLLIYATTGNTFTQLIAGKAITVGIIEYHPLVTSEHLLNGIRYPFGLVIITGIIHFDDKMQVIMGLEILFKEGRPNPFLQSLIEEDGEVSIASILPLSGVIDDYYYYSGSIDLPWPGCWETVSWVVPNYVLEASAAQIDYWAERYVQDLSFSNGRGSARDVQPLYNRTIYHFVSD